MYLSKNRSLSEKKTGTSVLVRMKCTSVRTIPIAEPSAGASEKTTMEMEYIRSDTYGMSINIDIPIK